MSEEYYNYYDNENEIKDIRADYCKDFGEGGLNLRVMRNRDITPEMSFISELWDIRNFFENYITDYEFDNIKSFLPYYNHHLNKNPCLILLSYVILKLTGENGSINKSIEFFSNKKLISELIKENSITHPDILRYCRYIKINIPKMYTYIITQSRADYFSNNQ